MSSDRTASGRRTSPARRDGSSSRRPRSGAAAGARYRAALGALFARRRFGLRPGLEVEHALLGALGHPERTFSAVHVTGSKGKGSVATMTAAILESHGLTTGLFTSPHLASYRERIRLDGRPIPPDDVVRGLGRVEAVARSLEADGTIDRAPTFFEVTTALAFNWFARNSADAAVVEVGLGGRLDATNVLDARVGVVTTVELEHTEILGPTVEAIAREKAGILHPGMYAVVGELPPAAAAVVRQTAEQLRVPVWWLGAELRTSDRQLDEDGQTVSVAAPGVRIARARLALFGTFQADNVALAVGAAHRFLEATGHGVDIAKVRRALARVRIPGRMQRLARAPELFFDVAHTPESARAVARSVAEVAPLADPAGSSLVFGCLRGKDVDAMLDALGPLARTIVIVPVRSERGLPPAAIRPAAVGRFSRVVLASDAERGLALARAATSVDGVTVVTGSDYLIGELLRGPDDKDEPDLSDPGVNAPGENAGPRPLSREVP